VRYRKGCTSHASSRESRRRRTRDSLPVNHKPCTKTTCVPDPLNGATAPRCKTLLQYSGSWRIVQYRSSRRNFGLLPSIRVRGMRGRVAARCARVVRWCLPAILPCVAAAAELNVTIKGLDKDLEQAVRSVLTLERYTSREVSAAQVRRLYGNAQREIRAALEPFGYYNPTVSSELQQTDRGYNALFDIAPGEPVLVQKANIEVRGDAMDVAPVRAAVKAFKPGPGD